MMAIISAIIMPTVAAAAPQYPQLLSGYSIRPPWQVAGVHFRVGPTSQPTKNPSAISMAGVSVDNRSRSIYVTGDDVVLDGYDFGLDGGWQVWVDGARATIRNCTFTLGTNTGTWQIGGQGAGMVIESCVMDSSTIQRQSGLINYRGPSLVVRKNWLKNFPQHAIEMTQGPGVVTALVYTDNLIENGGLGAPQGAHLNYLQWGHIAAGSQAIVSNNTVYQHIYAGGEGFQFYPNNGATGNSVAEFSYNTIIAPKGAQNRGITSAMSHVIHAGSGGQFGTNFRDNYFDYSGCNGAFYGNEPGNTYANNRNMLTGAVISPGSQ